MKKKRKKHWIRARAEAVWRSCKQAVQDLDKWMDTDEANWLIPMIAALAMTVSHLIQNRG